MPHRDEKITIRPEDLAAAEPLRIDVSTDHRSGEPDVAAPERPHVPRSRSAVLLLIVPAAFISAAFAAAITWHLARSPSSWTEQISATADRSVVRIDVGDQIGTGFVVSSDGARHLLMTNRHVVDSQQQVDVVLRSGRKAIGDVAGYPVDAEIDLALVVVDTAGLRPLGRIAPFASVHPGTEVAAVGHPLGLDYTITDGIISAKRGGMLLQTSTPINPGNSGGPLIYRRGDIVGVNTMMISPEQGQSLSFAFRADLLRDRERWRFLTDVDGLLDRVRY